MEQILSTPLVRKTALGDIVTTVDELDATGQFKTQHIELRTELQLERGSRLKGVRDTGRNWDKH